MTVFPTGDDDCVWPPLGIPSSTAHPYEFVNATWGCKTCGASMHCPHCGDQCGGQGHLVRDDAGFFLRCQEPDRGERHRLWLLDKLAQP